MRPKCTRLAALLGVLALFGIWATPSAEAGIRVRMTINGTPVALASGASSQLPGYDPATTPQTPGQREIALSSGQGAYTGGALPAGLNVDFTRNIDMTQSYSPASTIFPNISSALADTTSISIQNNGTVGANILIEVLYDNYASLPGQLLGLQVKSVLASTRLDGGATLTAINQILQSSGDPTTSPPTPGLFTDPVLAGGNIVHGTLTTSGTADTKFATVAGAAVFSDYQQIFLTLPMMAVANIQLSKTITAVPEPATVAMAISAAPLLGLLWLRRRAKA